MNNRLNGHIACSLAALSVIPLIACVDNDYDLSKDIDMNVTVGGNITLPPSSTDIYTMSQILDLDENSSIKPVGHLYGLSQNDYVLVQDGNTSPSKFRIEKVRVYDSDPESSTTRLEFTGTGIPSDPITAKVTDLTNTMELKDDNVDLQIVSLKEATADIEFSFRLDFKSLDNYSGNLTVNKGFTISFPEEWTIENLTAGGFTGMKDKHTLEFTSNHTLKAGAKLDLTFRVTKISLENVGEGQGLYAPGHFKLKRDIKSNGSVTISNGSLAAGSISRINVTTTPIVPDNATITTFTGIVNPNIDVAPTTFAITDVPDFLKEPGNNLDIDNPSIILTVNNTSPVDVNINALLKGTYNNGKDPVTVWIGDKHGTEPVMVRGNSITKLCLSRTGKSSVPGVVNITVPQLGTLITTIPDAVEMSNIDAKTPQDKYYTFVLGKEYSFTADYSLVVPLAFGPDLKFSYTTEDKGWDEDLDKYNFSEVLATVSVENTAPLDMLPHVKALDKRGNVMTDITATVEGNVAAGSLDKPSHSELKIILRSTAANIGELDGVLFEFDATAAPEYVGIPLNADQALKFTQIVLQLQGGIDIDLN